MHRKSKPAPPPRDHRSDPPSAITCLPIGVVRSPYTERHGTPRQPTAESVTHGADPQAGRIELDSDQIPERALKDLDGFDYIWVIAWLHLNRNWPAWVFPPRGPRVRRGVLATRAPHRPNPIGLSALRLVAVQGHTLHVEGLDLIDGTPVLDIKPYVPYADAFPDASAGWIDTL